MFTLIELNTLLGDTVAIKVNNDPLLLDCQNDIQISMDVYVSQPLSECVDGIIKGRLTTVTQGGITTSESEFNSGLDGYDTWVTVTQTITGPITSSSGVTDLYFHLFEGVKSCCDYEVYIKNLKIECTEELPNIVKIPKIGFNDNNLGDTEAGGVQRVIDNKKSWVYNPGLPNDGVKPTDEIIRNGGDRGLVDGYGKLNRKFSPSEDANLPYRQTNYQEQSSVLERHSDLVINSKEMFLTFNMKPLNGFCPNGYTLLSGSTCSNGVRNQEALNVSLINLEEYKKTFQSFWVKMTEQFIPATTIFVSGEKWANDPDDICSEMDECDFTTDTTDSDLSASLNNRTSIIFTESSGSLVNGSLNLLLINTLTTQFNSSLATSGSTENGDTIDFEALKLRALQDGSNLLLINGGEVTIDNLDRQTERMTIYRNNLNEVQEIISII